MNEDTIAFVLEDDEARLLDELYLQNKSIVSQMKILKTLSEYTEDQITYYINTLVGELIEPNPKMLEKYLSAMMKITDIPSNILLIFSKVLFSCQEKLDNYSLFIKFVNKNTM